MGAIVMTAASAVRPGDVFSTDGGVVTDVCRLSSPGEADEIAVYVICHGTCKTGYFPPAQLVPLWVETLTPCAR